MGRPASTTRISLTGHLSGGEIFDTSFWLDFAQVSQAENDALAEAVAGDLEAGPIGSLKGILNASSGYDKVRCYSYVDAAPAGATFVSETDLTGGTGVSTTGNGLDQACLVVTLRSASPGRRNRGRMYLPANGLPVSAGLASDNSQIDNIAAVMKALFDDINSVLIDGHRVAIVSGAASATKPVTAVSVDNKPDIQRRRANQLPASHTATQTLA